MDREKEQGKIKCYKRCVKKVEKQCIKKIKGK